MKFLALFCSFLLLCPNLFARSISLNLHSSGREPHKNVIDPDERAGLVRVEGRHWNNVGFAPGNLTDAKREARLRDDQGEKNALRFKSTLESAFVGYSGATAKPDEPGNRDLMHSYLAFGKNIDKGLLHFSNLHPSFVTSGYDLYVYFDTDNADRIHTITLTPGVGRPLIIVGNDSGTFKGNFRTAEGPGTYSNVAVFRDLSTAAFTLSMESSVGRAAVNGIQLVSSDHPMPPRIKRFEASRYYLQSGNQVELSWDTKGGKEILIQPGVGAVPTAQGKVTVSLHETTTYSLTVKNAAGTASTSLRVGIGTPRPNILFFLVDDMGWQDTSEPFHYDDQDRPILSALNKRYRTPNMERLADQAKKFTRTYVSSVCSPTRVSLMTGMNATRHHVTTWTYPSEARNTGSNGVKHLADPDWRTAGMDEMDIPLPRKLQELGYRTIHSGKAHFGPNGTFGGDPRDIGFDVNIAGHGAGGPGSYYGTANFGTGVWHIPGLEKYHGQDIFLTEALTLDMKDAISDAVKNGQPFFAYMAHYAVHGPFMLDQRFADHYPDLEGRPKAYATLVEGMDKSLGDLMDHIATLGVAENTLVIFLSDNGGDAPIKNGNAPLRGKKGHRHEGGLLVPLMIGWAKLDGRNSFQKKFPIAPDTRCHDLVAGYDLYPTLLKVAGGAVEHEIDGHDLTPYLLDKPGPHRPQELVTHFPHGHNHDHYSTFHQGDWKIVYNYGDRSYELYKLADDLAEANDLAQTAPEKLQAMAKAMKKALEENDAQFSIHRETGKPEPPVLP